MKRRLLPFLVIFAVSVPLLLSNGAFAASSVRNLSIASLDSRNPSDTRIQLLVDDPQNSPSYGFSVLENDKAKPVTASTKITDEIGAGQITRRTVFIVDTNASLFHSGLFDLEKTAVKSAIASLTGSGRDVATVVGVGNGYIRTGDFTNDKDTLNARVDTLTTQFSGRALNSSIGFAIDQLAQTPPSNDPQISNLVIFSSGASTDGDPSALKSRIDGNRISVLVSAIKVKESPGDFTALSNLAVNGQGIYRESDSPATMAKLSNDMSTALNNFWLLEYGSSAKGEMRVEVKANGKSAFAISNAGVLAQGSGLHSDVAKPPVTSKLPSIPPWALRLAITFFVMVFVGILVFVVSQLLDRKGSLEFALAPYQDKKIDADEEHDLHIETAIMRRALEVTESIARDRGIFVTVEEKLYQADLSINAAEYIFISVAVVVMFTVLGFASKGLLGGVIALAIGLLSAPSFLSYKASQRKRKFEKQLPDALQLLAGALRSGMSLLQGLDAMSQQVDDPLAKELRQALGEAKLGRSVEDAMQEMADRVQSVDFRWTVMAIKIQRDVGGNLAEVLDNVARTMIERERLRREVKALTAEGRMSAIVLGAMPPGMALYLYMAKPDYINILFTDSLGKLILGVAVGMMVAGGYWMKTMLRFDF